MTWTSQFARVFVTGEIGEEIQVMENVVRTSDDHVGSNFNLSPKITDRSATVITTGIVVS